MRRGGSDGQSWCDFAQKKLGKSETSVDGCETSLMEASLQSIGAMPLDVNNPYYDPDGLWNLPYVRAHGQESPLYDGAVDIETNKTVKAAPAADDDADDDGWYPGKLFGLPQPKGTSLRELTPMDASEYITKSCMRIWSSNSRLADWRLNLLLTHVRGPFRDRLGQRLQGQVLVAPRLPLPLHTPPPFPPPLL